MVSSSLALSTVSRYSHGPSAAGVYRAGPSDGPPMTYRRPSVASTKRISPFLFWIFHTSSVRVTMASHRATL